MGRSVHADEIAQAYIDALIKKGHWHIGLIIGQFSAQKDFVVLLARTPEATENEVCEVSEIGEEEDLPSQKRKCKTRPQTLDMADDHWLYTHAKQVTRMLPGGLDVIGIFVVAPAHILKDSQAKLRQMMFAAHKAMMKTMAVTSTDAITDRVILQVDSLSSKIVCSSLDVSNQKSTLRPAEWRYSSATKWLRLESSVAVDVSLPVSHEARNQSLHKSMQQAIAPFCRDIMNSVTLVSGEVREVSESLATFPEGKKGKGKEKDIGIQDTYHVDFLIPMHGTMDMEDPAVTEIKKLMSVRGIIACRAFVHWKACVGEAVEAIKVDAVRSLCARCELLSEDLDLTDESSVMECRKLYDTPVRVFTDANQSGGQVCDYVFQDEKTEEVVERIQELLDMSVTPDDLDMSCEHPASKSFLLSSWENDWVTASHSEHSLNSLVQDPAKSTPDKPSFTLYLSLAVSAAVAASAAVMSYFFLDTS